MTVTKIFPRAKRDQNRPIRLGCTVPHRYHSKKTCFGVHTILKTNTSAKNTSIFWANIYTNITVKGLTGYSISTQRVITPNTVRPRRVLRSTPTESCAVVLHSMAVLWRHRHVTPRLPLRPVAAIQYCQLDFKTPRRWFFFHNVKLLESKGKSHSWFQISSLGSDTWYFKYSILQGSTLSPVLFSLYFTNLWKIRVEGRCISFDDYTIYVYWKFKLCYIILGIYHFIPSSLKAKNFSVIITI